VKSEPAQDIETLADRGIRSGYTGAIMNRTTVPV
jgi:hypothetical protein